MSQQTYLVWYTDSPSVDPIRVLAMVPGIIGMERAELVYRTFRIIEGPDDDDGEQEKVGENVPASALAQFYRSGTTLFVSDDFARAGADIEQAIMTSFEEEVRGRHAPSRAVLDVGGYYFVDDADETETVTRYTALVGFWNYSTPYDYERMRKSVFSLPPVRDLKPQLESVMGPLSEAMYLSL